MTSRPEFPSFLTCVLALIPNRSVYSKVPCRPCQTQHARVSAAIFRVADSKFSVLSICPLFKHRLPTARTLHGGSLQLDRTGECKSICWLGSFNTVPIDKYRITAAWENRCRRLPLSDLVGRCVGKGRSRGQGLSICSDLERFAYIIASDWTMPRFDSISMWDYNSHVHDFRANHCAGWIVVT